MTTNLNELSSDEAERHVLSALMLHASVAEDVQGTLRPDDFWTPRHQTIAEVIWALADEGAPIDPISVADRLDADNKLIQAGGMEYVLELHGYTPTHVNAGYYADIVREHSQRRRVRIVGARLEQLASDRALPIEDLTEQSRALIDQALDIRSVASVTSGDVAKRVYESIGKSSVGLPTPWRSLTRIIRGFRPGGLYIIAARPGVGKSALALQCAHALETYGHVAYFSLEMSADEVTQRLIAQAAQVPLPMVDGSEKMTDDMRQRAESWLASYSGRILFDDRSTITMGEIKAQVRSWHRVTPLVAVVIDYTQLITGPSDMDRTRLVGELTRQAKNMAGDLQLPVIMLSQLNRNAEARVDKRPALADLRESGSIEQDADVVILLYNATRSSGQDSGPQGDALELIVAKNRQGPAMTAHLLWRGRYVTATDIN